MWPFYVPRVKYNMCNFLSIKTQYATAESMVFSSWEDVVLLLTTFQFLCKEISLLYVVPSSDIFYWFYFWSFLSFKSLDVHTAWTFDYILIYNFDDEVNLFPLTTVTWHFVGSLVSKFFVINEKWQFKCMKM